MEWCNDFISPIFLLSPLLGSKLFEGKEIVLFTFISKESRTVCGTEKILNTYLVDGDPVNSNSCEYFLNAIPISHLFLTTTLISYI